MGHKSYEADGIVIHFDRRRCIHAAECVRGLPAVFEADRRPWIEPDAAEVQEIVAVVHRCPTGALRYERRDGGPPEPVDPSPTITPAANGPLYLRGACTVSDAEGVRIEVGPRAALCRCGASKNKPYCDNSHVEAGFRDQP